MFWPNFKINRKFSKLRHINQLAKENKVQSDLLKDQDHQIDLRLKVHQIRNFKDIYIEKK